MDELGIYANLVYGPFDDEKTQERCKMLLDAACAAMGMRGQTLGLGGGRCMGMLTAVCDPNEIKKQFGVEIDAFEQSEIIDRAEKIDDARAYEFLSWMKSTFGKLIACEEALESDKSSCIMH